LKKIIIISAIFLFSSVVSFAQLGGLAGSFSRMGFGSRGISMGNAMTSVTDGDVIGYYNPAVSVFQNDHLVNLSYSFLAFDRTLNFVSYTKNFKIPGQKEGGAGITISWINAGVSNIDGRDADGFPIGTYSTNENQFLFAPSFQVSKAVSLGVGFKLYYSKLFDGVKSTTVGFDVGTIIKPSDRISIGVAIKDLDSKYIWNTTSIYQENGTTTTDKFPVLMDLGVSYELPKNIGLVAVDLENSSNTTSQNGIDYKSSSTVLKMGAEFNLVKNLQLRAGFDRFDFQSNDIYGNTNVMFGVGYQVGFKSYTVGLDYSFVMEAYSNSPFQTLTAVFKLH